MPHSFVVLGQLWWWFGVFFFFLQTGKLTMSGINNTGRNLVPRSGQPASDYGAPGVKQGLPVVQADLLPTIKAGGNTTTRLPQVVAEPVQSVDVLVSSSNRISGTLFDFTADIGSSVFRPRLITVDSAVLPKLYNITPLNNHVHIIGVVEADAANADIVPEVDFSLTVGYYDTTTFGQEFVARANEAVNTALADWNYRTNKFVRSIVTNFVFTFDPIKNHLQWGSSDASINYASTSGGASAGTEDVPISWWFVPGGNFTSERSRNFAPFDTNPPPETSSSTPPTPNTQSGQGEVVTSLGQKAARGIPSGLAGMQYTRFCTLSSTVINRFSYDESRVSRPGDGGGRGKIISVIDTSLFQILGDGFAGSFLPAQRPNAPFININNAQGQLEQFLDFVVRDEFGDSLDLMFDDPKDKLGITFWMKITF